MFRYYLAIGILWAFSFSLVIAGFLLVGTPVSQQKIQLDRTRISRFASLKTSITTYYRDYGKLPSHLSDLAQASSGESSIDPETHKEFTYIPKSDLTYALC